MTNKAPEQPQNVNEDENESNWNLMFGPAAEFLFVLLPLLVLAIVFLSLGKSIRTVLGSAEWSFGAAVLFGQAIIKLVSGTLHRGIERGWELVVLIISVTIVLGLVPSLTVLSLILTAEHPSTALIAGQLALFVFGALVFFSLGAIGHYGLFHDK